MRRARLDDEPRLGASPTDQEILEDVCYPLMEVELAPHDDYILALFIEAISRIGSVDLAFVTFSNGVRGVAALQAGDRSPDAGPQIIKAYRAAAAKPAAIHEIANEDDY